MIKHFTRSKKKVSVAVGSESSESIKRKMPDSPTVSDPNAKKQREDPLADFNNLERQLDMVDSQKIFEEVAAMMQESQETGNDKEEVVSVKKKLVYALSIHKSKDLRLPISIRQFELFQSFLWKLRINMSAEENEKLNIEYLCHHRTMGRININTVPNLSPSTSFSSWLFNNFYC